MVFDRFINLLIEFGRQVKGLSDKVFKVFERNFKENMIYNRSYIFIMHERGECRMCIWFGINDAITPDGG